MCVLRPLPCRVSAPLCYLGDDAVCSLRNRGVTAIGSQLVDVCAECTLFIPGSLAVVVGPVSLMDLLYRRKMAPSSQENGSVAVDGLSVQLFPVDLVPKVDGSVVTWVMIQRLLMDSRPVSVLGYGSAILLLSILPALAVVWWFWFFCLNA